MSLGLHWVVRKILFRQPRLKKIFLLAKPYAKEQELFNIFSQCSSLSNEEFEKSIFNLLFPGSDDSQDQRSEEKHVLSYFKKVFSGVLDKDDSLLIQPILKT